MHVAESVLKIAKENGLHEIP